MDSAKLVAQVAARVQACAVVERIAASRCSPEGVKSNSVLAIVAGTAFNPHIRVVAAARISDPVASRVALERLGCAHLADKGASGLTPLDVVVASKDPAILAKIALETEGYRDLSQAAVDNSALVDGRVIIDAIKSGLHAEAALEKVTDRALLLELAMEDGRVRRSVRSSARSDGVAQVSFEFYSPPIFAMMRITQLPEPVEPWIRERLDRLRDDMDKAR